jgi:hypothetical protein
VCVCVRERERERERVAGIPPVFQGCWDGRTIPNLSRKSAFTLFYAAVIMGTQQRIRPLSCGTSLFWDPCKGLGCLSVFAVSRARICMLLLLAVLQLSFVLLVIITHGMSVSVIKIRTGSNVAVFLSSVSVAVSLSIPL